MEYNWGDPKKNSLLSSRMMAKAEVTRKKRLTSVKSTLSNQLHPAIEHKLRKKKKAPDSARAPTSCSNNDQHETQTPSKAEPQMTSDDESSTLDTIRHDAFPVPARASLPNNVSMFDEFGLNAAADGLFHPASTIEAFTEHDAKYHQEIHHSSATKPHSGPRRARPGSEYPPSRENHRLPALHSGKNKRERLSTRPKQSTGTISGSAPASITTTASLSKLVDTDEGKRSLSATQSDSNLYAPRRSDAVPSSADRNALDFLEREQESDEDNNAHNSPVGKSSRGVSELDNNEIPEESSAVVPALDFSLAKKFEELKRIMKSNREKHNSARQDPEHSGACAAGPSTTTSTTTSPKSSARSAIRAAPSGSSATKTGGETASKVGGAAKRSTPAARATKAMHSNESGSKRALPVTNHTTGAASRKTSSSVVVAVAPPVRSKREMKVRSGVSLSDLKAEHREALQMLKELGGPMDPDYLLVDIDHGSSSRPGRAGARAAGLSRSTGSTVANAGRTTHSNQAQSRSSASTPPTSANSGISMVTKLRESISSGRSTSRESSPRTSSPTVRDGDEEKETATSSGSSDGAVPASNQELTEGNASPVPVRDQADAVEGKAGSDPVQSSSLPTPSTADAPDPWKQYEDDDHVDDEEEGDEEDNNELERESSSEVKKELTSGDHYSDEGFESDW